MASGQSRGGAMRPHPKLLRVATNLISSSEIRDFWLSDMGGPEDSDLYQFHVIYSQLIDNHAIENKFICKPDEAKSPHRMIRSINVLQSIKIKLIDENARIVQFPPKTTCRLGLTMTPYRPEDNH